MKEDRIRLRRSSPLLEVMVRLKDTHGVREQRRSSYYSKMVFYSFVKSHKDTTAAAR